MSSTTATTSESTSPTSLDSKTAASAPQVAVIAQQEQSANPSQLQLALPESATSAVSAAPEAAPLPLTSSSEPRDGGLQISGAAAMELDLLDESLHDGESPQALRTRSTSNLIVGLDALLMPSGKSAADNEKPLPPGAHVLDGDTVLLPAAQRPRPD